MLVFEHNVCSCELLELVFRRYRGLTWSSLTTVVFCQAVAGMCFVPYGAQTLSDSSIFLSTTTQMGFLFSSNSREAGNLL